MICHSCSQALCFPCAMNFYAIFLTWDWIFCQLMASQAYMLKLPRSRARWMQGFNHYKVENPTPSDSQELNPISPYDPWALCPDWLIRFWLSCTETHVSSGSRPWSLYSFLHEDQRFLVFAGSFRAEALQTVLYLGNQIHSKQWWILQLPLLLIYEALKCALIALFLKLHTGLV